MAQLGTTFDPSSAPPSERSFDLIPKSWQPMQVVESDMQATRDGTGQMASFTFEIIDGPFKGRKIWKRMNVVNKSAQAQEIGRRELADLCRAVGLASITDTEQTHGKPFTGRVGVEKGDGQYEDKNTVVGFKPFENPAPNVAGGSAVTQGGAGTTAAASRPWG